MGLFCRIVLLVVSAGLVCGLRKAAPDGHDTWRSEVTVKLNALREYMEPHVAKVAHELNSLHERVEPHMTKAKVEFDTLCEQVGPVLDKHLAEAKMKATEAKVIAVKHLAAAKVKAGEFSSRSRVKLQEMHASAAPTYKKYSAIARVKAEAFSESVAQKFDEASASVQVLYASGRNASSSMGARTVQEFTELKKWSQSGALSVLMKEVPRKATAAAQTFREQVRTVVNQAPRDMDAFKEFYENVTLAQLCDCLTVAGFAFFAVYLFLEISLFIAGLCLALLRAFSCRRRQAPVALDQEPQFSSGIFVDTVPSVVQQRSMNVTRRRRSDSPGAVAPRGRFSQVQEDLEMRIARDEEQRMDKDRIELWIDSISIYEPEY